MTSLLDFVNNSHEKNISVIRAIINEFTLDDARYWVAGSRELEPIENDGKVIADKYIPYFKEMDPDSIPKVPFDIQETIRQLAKFILDFLFGSSAHLVAEEGRSSPEGEAHDELIEKLQRIIRTYKPANTPKP